MKRLPLWDGVRDGRPFFKDDHPLIRNEDERAHAIEYLRSGTVVVAARGMLPDHVRGDDEPTVPIIFYTDGEWVWTEEHIYYLEQYGIVPSSAFMSQIAGRRSAATVDDQKLREAEELIKG